MMLNLMERLQQLATAFELQGWSVAFVASHDETARCHFSRDVDPAAFARALLRRYDAPATEGTPTTTPE